MCSSKKHICFCNHQAQPDEWIERGVNQRRSEALSLSNERWSCFKKTWYTLDCWVGDGLKKRPSPTQQLSVYRDCLKHDHVSLLNERASDLLWFTPLSIHSPGCAWWLQKHCRFVDSKGFQQSSFGLPSISIRLMLNFYEKISSFLLPLNSMALGSVPISHGKSILPLTHILHFFLNSKKTVQGLYYHYCGALTHLLHIT